MCGSASKPCASDLYFLLLFTRSEGDEGEEDPMLASADEVKLQGTQRKNGVLEHLDEVGKAAIAVVLTPVLVAHFFVMMLPMRIAYAATARKGDNGVIDTERSVEEAVAPAMEHKRAKTDKDGSDQNSQADGEGADIVTSSEALPLTGDPQGEKGGKEPRSKASEMSVNAIPALMRENLARPELGIQR